MAKAQTGAISFGLVHIPISLYTATKDDEVHFNQLYKEDMSRIRYKKTAGESGREVDGKDIVKGYEYEKDKYVLVTDDEMERIKTEKDRSIRILQFTNVESIPIIYFNKPYYVLPEKGGERAFSLLRTAMQSQGKAAIGKTVLGSKETILALVPTAEGLVMQTMFYQSQIREVPKDVTYPEPAAEELEMAKLLLNSMDKPFDPGLYKDEYQERLRGLIEDKIEGKEVIAPPEAQGAQIINLMDALKASLAQADSADHEGAAQEKSSQPRKKRKAG